MEMQLLKTTGSQTLIENDPPEVLFTSANSQPISAGNLDSLVAQLNVRAQNETITAASLALKLQKRNDANTWEDLGTMTIPIEGGDSAFPVLIETIEYTGSDFGTVQIRALASCSGSNVSLTYASLLIHGVYTKTG